MSFFKLLYQGQRRGLKTFLKRDISGEPFCCSHKQMCDNLYKTFTFLTQLNSHPYMTPGKLFFSCVFLCMMAFLKKRNLYVRNLSEMELTRRENIMSPHSALAHTENYEPKGWKIFTQSFTFRILCFQTSCGIIKGFEVWNVDRTRQKVKIQD